MTTTNWMDISVPIHTGMAHWPDDPPVRVEYMLHIERGDICTVSTLSMGSHTGTHMDGPFHFLPEGQGLHEMPLDAAIGRAHVIGEYSVEIIQMVAACMASDMRVEQVAELQLAYPTFTEAVGWRHRN